MFDEYKDWYFKKTHNITIFGLILIYLLGCITTDFFNYFNWEYIVKPSLIGLILVTFIISYGFMLSFNKCNKY